MGAVGDKTCESMELVLAEFWDKQPNLNPTVSSFKKYFPDIKVKVITEGEDICDKNHERYGYRMNDYHTAKMLLESEEDIAISSDADMKVVSERVKDIIPLVKRFGLCVPSNSRWLAGIDAEIGEDGQKIEKPIRSGYALNISPIFFYTRNKRMRKLLEVYAEMLKENPRRGTQVMSEATYKTGIVPYILPPQWCVCTPDVGIGNEIILHVGNKEVKDYYNG